MSLSVDKILRKAESCMKAGELAESEKLYKQVFAYLARKNLNNEDIADTILKGKTKLIRLDPSSCELLTNDCNRTSEK